MLSMAHSRVYSVTTFSMKLTTALIVALVLGSTIVLASTITPVTAEDSRYRAHLVSQGLDPSLYLPLEVSVPPSSIPDAPQPIVEAASTTWKLNPDFVASSDDKLEGCTGNHSRFCKIKPSLLPIYEKVSKETGVPAALLYAVGEYETHNRARNVSDGGRSCGLAGFNTWKSWGFSSLEDCFNPESNIRKLAESYTKNGGAENTRTWLRVHNGGRGGLSMPVTATYATQVMKYANELYAG